MGGGADDDEFPRRDERFPQWSYQETRDFIEIRAQLEWNFNTAKRNKNLWEMVAARMREKGYRRTLDQCKGKWKNLAQETSDLENGRQCPFFDELHALFTARANRIQPVQPESETGSLKGKKRLKNVSVDQSYEEVSEEQEGEEETDLDQGGKQRAAPKTKPSGEKRQKTANVEKISGQPLTKNNDNVLSGLQEIMMSFMQQQQMIDMQWKESMEKRAHERDVFEQEWRQTMENLERERLMMEKAWRERDEQRRLREESRAEKRDALLTTLLNKLFRDENH
ncbi:hypothetical protein BUALT_Bualt10G0083400 [Buddleja alternifolia]|uniref:Myb-like domain-containing protein n=1 Tax=Buddleja alternifolia TaxID=168488 RepID=A0AAV6X583_9LAMI|nr:hypothetical protein BUALT_Bualt10G0083400 [Buddleja alternifolia]